MCGSLWTIWTSESKQAKFLLFHILYPHSRMSFITLEGKLSISPVLILFSQRLEMKERSQVTVRNQRPTAAGNYLEYFVPFALTTPWSAAEAVKITRCRPDSESTCTKTASKVHPWAPTPAIFHWLFNAGKNLRAKDVTQNSMAVCQMRRNSLRIS